MRRFFSGLPALALAMAPPTIADEGAGVVGGLTLTSDYVFRGTSQTLGEAAVQAYVGLEADSGLYSYVWASNVDFVPDEEPDDGARYEINAAVGFAADLSDRLTIDATLVRYLFPGTAGDVSYDYTELLVTLEYREFIAATLGYSDRVFGADAAGMFHALSLNRELPAGFSINARLGHYDLDDALGASYAFSDLAVSRGFGEIDVTLGWHDTFGDADELFYGQAIGSRAVLSLALEFQ